MNGKDFKGLLLKAELSSGERRQRPRYDDRDNRRDDRRDNIAPRRDYDRDREYRRDYDRRAPSPNVRRRSPSYTRRDRSRSPHGNRAAYSARY
jgi:hypothetical protein